MRKKWANYIRAGDALDPEKVRAELKEYGAWDSAELSNHADNIRRLVWIAAGDISEEVRP